MEPFGTMRTDLTDSYGLKLTSDDKLSTNLALILLMKLDTFFVWWSSAQKQSEENGDVDGRINNPLGCDWILTRKEEGTHGDLGEREGDFLRP